MLNFRKFISVSAVAILGVTTWLTPLSYADAAKNWAELASGDLTANPLQFIMPDHDVYFYAITAANKYFVQYHGNNETSGEMGTGVFTYDTTGHLDPNEFIRTGYTWNSWNTQASGSGQSYSSGAAVWNWTTVESGVEHIYAQWNANTYNISYDLNDSDGTSSGVHPKTPTTGEYDKSLTIQHPSRTGYAFSGWTITNMDSEEHTIGSGTSHEETENGVMATSFANLRATSGTVNFKAIWTKNQHTPYTVEHYLQTLTGGYPEMHEDIDNLSGVTDEEVTPDTNTYTGFTAPEKQTVNIDADGSTNVRYEYTRNHYDLKLVAGRGIASVSGTGTVTAGDSAGASGSTTISFLYDEPVTVDFELKPGYTGGVWSGYASGASSFHMDAASGTKTASATPIDYQLTVNPRGGNGATGSRTYTVEDDDIPLGTPTRDHSTFLGWTGGVNGEGITSPTKGVMVTGGSLYDREYSAVWSCITGYHLEATGSSSESCQPDTDTKYLVNHIQQDLSGNYTIYIETGYRYGVTNTNTAVTGRNDAGFELSGTIDSYNKNIEPDGSTIVNIYYNRLEYVGTIETATGVTDTSASGENSGTSPFKYEDTVELSATVEPGYTWSGWTVEDASGNSITVTDTSPTDPNGATFQMPASTVTITPHVTRDSYTIEYELYSGTEQSPNPTSYNVESEEIKLNTPRRDHSVFEGWTGGVIDGEQLSGTTNPVIIAKGSVGNRKYYAVWSCATGYHAVGTDSCVANEYNVTINYNDGDHSAASTGFTYDTTGYIPEPAQSGYDFAGWTITGMSGGVVHTIGSGTTTADSASGVHGTTFENLTVEDGGTVTLVAQWTPRDDTKYVVHHFTENLSGGTYKLEDTVEYSGSVADPVEISSITTGAYSGFTVPTSGYLAGGTDGPSGTASGAIVIDKHGTTEIFLFYSRNDYHVYLSGDAHVDTLVGSGAYKFGATVEISATAKAGYHFVRWEKRKSNRSKES